MQVRFVLAFKILSVNPITCSMLGAGMVWIVAR